MHRTSDISSLLGLMLERKSASMEGPPPDEEPELSRSQPEPQDLQRHGRRPHHSGVAGPSHTGRTSAGDHQFDVLPPLHSAGIPIPRYS